MMIIGFIVTAGVAGKLLDPFSPGRLVAVAAVIAGATTPEQIRANAEAGSAWTPTAEDLAAIDTIFPA